VRVVTLSVGGNDARTVIPLCVGGPTPGCVQGVGAMLSGVATNLSQILGALRAAAGPDTPIVVMTYYNALLSPACPLNPLAGLAWAVLEGDPALGLPVGVNDVIRAVAAANGARVAETPALIGPADLAGDCIHLNDAGYAKAAGAFEAAYGAP
jgi:lysophospholipase L1-like esterase